MIAPPVSPPSAEIEAIRQRLLKTENRIRPRRAVKLRLRRSLPLRGWGVPR